VDGDLRLRETLILRQGRRTLTLAPDATHVTPLDLLVSGLGLCVALFGALILVKGRDRRAAVGFWRMSTLIGLALGVVPAGFHGMAWAIALTFVTLTLFAPALLTLAWIFPSRDGPPRCRFTTGVWVPAFILVLLYPLCWRQPGSLFLLIQTGSDALFAGYTLATCARFVWILSHPHSALQQAQLQWTTLGVIGGFTPLVTLNLLPYLLTGRFLVPPEIGALALILLPLGVGAAIVRTEFLGIAGLVRRRTLRVTLSVALLASMTVAAALFAVAGQQRWHWSTPAVAIGASLLTAIGCVAFRPPFLRWAERLVLHDVYDSGDTLRQVRLDFAQAPPSEVGALVVTRLSNVLNLTDALLLTPTSQWSYVRSRETDPGTVQEAVVQRALHMFVEPQPRAAFIERTADLPILFLPVWDGSNLHAMLCLGPKRGGDLYTAQDYTLLDTLVQHLALFFVNQRLRTRNEERVCVDAAPPRLTVQLVSANRAHHGPPLSPREIEALCHLAEGLTNKEIAERMVVVEKTAHKHVAAVFSKLGARNRTEAVAIACRDRLLSPE